MTKAKRVLPGVGAQRRQRMQNTHASRRRPVCKLAQGSVSPICKARVTRWPYWSILRIRYAFGRKPGSAGDDFQRQCCAAGSYGMRSHTRNIVAATLACATHEYTVALKALTRGVRNYDLRFTTFWVVNRKFSKMRSSINSQLASKFM